MTDDALIPVTIARGSKGYPRKLEEKLGKGAPALFWACGDVSLPDAPCAAIVGSRDVDAREEALARAFAQRLCARGYTIVSGGARGVDRAAMDAALEAGGRCIGYLYGYLTEAAMRKPFARAIREGRLLLLTANAPSEEYRPGMTQARNRYIYAQSEAAFVICCENARGGTWSGATYAMKKDLCPVYCVADAEREGNRALVQNGAIAIPPDWDGPLETRECEKQLSMFG